MTKYPFLHKTRRIYLCGINAEEASARDQLHCLALLVVIQIDKASLENIPVHTGRIRIVEELAPTTTVCVGKIITDKVFRHGFPGSEWIREPHTGKNEE